MVYLIVLACVLRATTKERSPTFSPFLRKKVHPRENPGYAYEFAHPWKKILRVPMTMCMQTLCVHKQQRITSEICSQRSQLQPMTVCTFLVQPELTVSIPHNRLILTKIHSKTSRVERYSAKLIKFPFTKIKLPFIML